MKGQEAVCERSARPCCILTATESALPSHRLQQGLHTLLFSPSESPGPSAFPVLWHSTVPATSGLRCWCVKTSLTRIPATLREPLHAHMLLLCAESMALTLS